jgi:anti-anti-sigma factor
MKHSVSTRKELTILKLEEEVFDVRHASDFRQAIESLVNNENSRNLIIDFSPVKAIDSSGISSMLLAHQLANQSEGLAIFVSLCHQIKDLLKLTNLDKQLYIFSSINEVMTLIEPAMKGKRVHKGRSQPVRFEPVDELVDEIEILPDTVFEDEHFVNGIDEHHDQAGEHEELNEPVTQESIPKKRGRPRKNDSDSIEKNGKST